MNCDEFRMSIAERLDNELDASQTQEFDAHAKTCHACQVALAEWQHLAETLRAGWPSVEPPPHGLLLPQPQPRSSWLEAAQRWFGYASMALVASSLLLLIILRPTVHLDGHELALGFGAQRGNVVSNASAPLTQQQVQSMIQVALRETAIQQANAPQTASQALSQEQAQRVNELAVRLKMLEETQSSLWQRNEEQRIYLESLWSKSQTSGPPAPDSPNGQ